MKSSNKSHSNRFVLDNLFFNYYHAFMHQQIVFWKCPVIFLKDKFRRFAYEFSTYFPTLVTWILAIFGFLAGIWAIFSRDIVIVFLSIIIFIFGTINIWLATNLEKFKIRFDREKLSFSSLHKISHYLRDFRSYKDNKQLDKDKTFSILNSICDVLLNEYMNLRHQGNVSLTLKIHKKGKLYPIIRLGDASIRTKAPENIEDSGFYKLFSQGKQKYIYIFDINRCSKEELEDLEGYSKEITLRAESHRYKTFIALPINLGMRFAGDEKYSQKLHISNCLGFVGFDKQNSSEFGNIDDFEINFLGSVVDSCSEIVKDYQDYII